MNRLQNYIRRNSMFIMIVNTLILTIFLVSFIVTFVVMSMNESSFMHAYVNQMTLLTNQIVDDYDDLNTSVIHSLNLCDDSNVCQAFLNATDLSNTERYNLAYDIFHQFKDVSILANDTPGTLLLVSLTNDSTFINSSSTKKTKSVEEILNSQVVQNALNNPDEITYQYLDTRFVDSGYYDDSIIAIKVLKDASLQPYGLAIQMINQRDFQNYFSSIDPTTTDITIMNTKGIVLSADESDILGKENKTLLQRIQEHGTNTVYVNESGNIKQTEFSKYIPSFDAYITLTIDNSEFLSSINQYSILYFIILVIGVIACIIVFFIIRRTTKPMRMLIEKMKTVVSGDFKDEIPVQGSGEVRELTIAYNYMLEGLNAYVNQLMELQEQKRLSEIHALQMQINPHFVYNTLTSFKFMIWQQDSETLIQAIDAFIKLLRETLGNTDEIVSVEKEIENLKNYVFIQKIRFGKKVNVNYMIQDACKHLMIPKMILQPFIENAFFHAFQDSESGVIDVCGRIRKDKLVFEVIDNGSGLPENLQLNPTEEKGKKFSGIGITNVHERIQLLYGKDYGVHVSSTKGRGTIIQITLPMKTGEV